MTSRRTAPHACPVEACLALIASKYKPLILWKLERTGGLRFGELVRAIPSGSKKMIAQTLRELEADGLVHRQVLGARAPFETHYRLTERGASLHDVLSACAEWTKKDREGAT